MDAKKYNENKKKNKIVKASACRQSFLKANQESEYFGATPTVRPRGKIDRNGDLWMELEDWAEHTKAIHLSEFCTPRKFSVKRLTEEAKTNQLLNESLEKAQDKIAKNIRDQWQLDYRLNDFSKMYLPIFDRVIKDNRMELTKMVSEKIAASHANINIIDSSGYLKPNKKDIHEVTIENTSI